jgi:UDP-N-acetylmuramoyl-L-alanyl-D-glutamate--2,6-diaminopimelate ligase
VPAGRLTPDPVILAPFYARMRRELAGVRTIGVTGTKGKTSTTEFIAQLMESSGLRTAVSTTESARIGTRYLEPCEHLGHFAAFVRRCRRSRIECLVVELCSSVLRWDAQHGLDLDAAVLTNIGTDHIVDHGNVRNYVAIKQRLFRDLAPGPASPRPVAILNTDDRYFGAFRATLASGVRLGTYALGAHRAIVADPSPDASLSLTANRIEARRDGTGLIVHGLPGGPRRCRIPLHGNFNVANVLAALACAVSLGADPDTMIEAIRKLVPPPGRFEIVAAPSPRHPAVVVDYAHTPESLASALAAARAFAPGGRVHAVFGCGGDCYKGKRPLMGAIAAREADATIVTTDNPRGEDPRGIIRGILRGVPARRRAAVRVEPDRAGAIELAVSSAAAGDVVVLLGKGAERTQEIAGRTYRFSDTHAARRALERRLGSADVHGHPRLSAESALMLDARGRVLVARRADAPHAPASLVKLMTLYLAYEDLAAGRTGLDDRVRISGYAALTPHPRLPLREGDTLPMLSVLGAVAIRSSNAAATALAEHLAGDEAAFVTRMNRRAKTLGLTATRFATAHGLPHRHQRTTARDAARLLGRLLADHPASAKALGGREVVFRGRTYRRNIPLFRDPGGIVALKTGFTGEAGYNLAVATRRPGGSVLLVVLGAPTRASSFADARRLLRHRPAPSIV